MKTKTEWLVKIREGGYANYYYFNTKEKAKKFIINYYNKNKNKITMICIECDRRTKNRSIYFYEDVIYQKFPNGSSKMYSSSIIKFKRSEL